MPVKVSVVIPAYNSRETIVAALESVEAQTFRDFEVILVDDASTDDTVAVVEEFFRALPLQSETSHAKTPRTPRDDRTSGTATVHALANDPIPESTNSRIDRSPNLPINQSPRHRVIQSPTNRGPAGARNRGIAEARGEWVAFLDADDLWLPDRLRFSLAAMRDHPEAGMICGGAVELNGDVMPDQVIGDAATQNAPIGPLRIESLAIFNPVTTSTVTVRRDVLTDLGGFDEQFRGPEDYDLWIRVAASVPSLYTDLNLAKYGDRAGGLSMDERRFLPQVLRVLDKAYGPGGGLVGHGVKRRAVAYQLLSASWMAANRGDVARAWSLFAKALVLWPFPFGPAHRYRWVRAKLVVCFLRHMMRGLNHGGTETPAFAPAAAGLLRRGRRRRTGKRFAKGSHD